MIKECFVAMEEKWLLISNFFPMSGLSNVYTQQVIY